MKKIKSVLLLICILCLTIGCSEKKKEPADFWEATLSVLEDKLENNGYDKGNWNIGVEDLSQAKDKNHRSLTIRQMYEDETLEKTSMLSFQNNDKKYISFIYKQTDYDDEKEYAHTIEVKSIDKSYLHYEINYAYQEFRNGNYFDGKETKGSLTVNKDNTITYDNVPLLNIAMENCDTLIQDFEKEFDIQYQDYDFVNIAALAKKANIPTIEQISPEMATTIDYYAKPHINAKGFSLVAFLKVSKDYGEVDFGCYNVERQGYDFNYSLTLEKRELENCYNIVQTGDPEERYAVYINQNDAYMYLQSKSDAEIELDVSQGAPNAAYILNTENSSYQ